MSPVRTARYKGDVAKLQKQYAGKLDILYGLEWDLFSDDDPSKYDYWIGSTHYIHGPKTGKYYEIDWRESDLADCINTEFDGDGLAAVEAYFDNVKKLAALRPTILGHFDLIKRSTAATSSLTRTRPATIRRQATRWPWRPATAACWSSTPAASPAASGRISSPRTPS